MMLGGVECALGGCGTYSTDDAKLIDSTLEMPVDTEKAGKQQSTHRRDDAYVIERCISLQGDQAARRGCCGQWNDCVRSMQNQIVNILGLRVSHEPC
jgi:hypothetical protein